MSENSRIFFLIQSAKNIYHLKQILKNETDDWLIKRNLSV